MELHQVRYVVAVARTGNFSRAAEQCHVAQPSISQQIQKLEDELGERLFDRTKRAARLTEHGEAFLLRATRILEEVDAVKREAKDAKDLLRGRLTVGVLPTIAPYLLPGVLAKFTGKYPASKSSCTKTPRRDCSGSRTHTRSILPSPACPSRISAWR